MRTTTKNRIKKALGLAALCMGLSTAAIAQCNLSFTASQAGAGQINFTNTSTGLSGSPTYNWNFGYQNYSSTVSSPTFTYSYNGTYTVSLVVNDSANNCFSSTTQTVTISNTANAPACSSSFTYSTGSNGLVSFTNTSTTFTTTNNNSWSFGNGGYDYTTSPSHTYIYNGNYVVSLSIGNAAANCFSTSTQTITVSNAMALPPCDSSYTYTTGANGLVNFTSNYTGSPVSTNYNWNFGNNTYGTGAAPSVTYPYNGTYNVTLSVQDSAAHCGNYYTSSVTVTNSGTPPACGSSFTYTTGGTGLANFTNTSPSDTLSTSNYSWNFGDFNYSSATSPSHTYLYNGSYVVTLSVSNNQSGCNISSTQTVTISNAASAPPCTAAFTDTVTYNGHVLFTSQYLAAPASAAFYWDFGYNGNYAVSDSNVTFNYPYNGTYAVTLTITDSVNNCFTSFTDSVLITNAGTGCNPATVSFSMQQDSLNTSVWNVYPAYSSSVNSAVWNWGDSTGTTSGLYPTHTFPSAGWYNICVTVYNSCGNTGNYCLNDSIYKMMQGTMIQLNVINTNATGIKTVNEENASFKLFPNPNNGQFMLNIEGLNTNITSINISVQNLIGQSVYQTRSGVANGKLLKEIDMKGLPDGIYFMKVNTGNKIYTVKTIIGQ